jgi:NADH-quinone oxidoreductase subunit A
MQPSTFISNFSPWTPGLGAFLLYGGMVTALIALLLFLAYWLGEKKPTAEKNRPYECGIIPTGPARLSLPVPFYLVAVFFLIFDVEAVFIFTWAVAFQELGWPGWLAISFFILLLLAGLYYIWKKQGLEWVQHFETIFSVKK